MPTPKNTNEKARPLTAPVLVKLGKRPIPIAYVELLPPLSIAEYEALKNDIEVNGQRDPILVDEDGTILDGRHRDRILGGNAKRRVIRGLSEAEKQAFVIRSNLTRRNLSPSQKAEVRKVQKKIAKRLREEDPKRWTQQRVAETLGVTQQCVAKWNTANTTGCNSCITDARVKIPPQAKPVIADRVESGETQQQVAADFGVSQQTISTIVKQSIWLNGKKP